MAEHHEQAMLMRWAEAHRHIWPELGLLHAVQNWAGVKGPAEGGRRKREGVRAGVPDLHLPVARGRYHSLYIEMKRDELTAGKNGVRRVRTQPTATQRQWHEALREAGNAVSVCWSAQEAEAVIEAYLGGRYDALNHGGDHG